jgi:molybdenum cofactor cytidylyltransferase
MGTSKALLGVPPSDTFLSRLLSTLRSGGIAAPSVVVRPDDEAVRIEVARCKAELVVNPAAESGGQLSSILAGLSAVDDPGLRALLVAPVDAPLVQASTITALLAAFNATEPPVVRPQYRGRHGHPVLFSRAVFTDLRRADPTVGAKAVVRAHERTIVNVEVDDPGVLGDVDTPEAYRALFGRDPFPQI